MKIRTMAWFAGSALVVAMGGVGAAACSSSDATGNPSLPTGAADGSTGTADGPVTTTPVDGGGTTDMDGMIVEPDMDGGTTADTGTACKSPPLLHVPKPDGGLYCPFSFNDATDAGIQYCTDFTQTCCIKAYAGGTSIPSRAPAPTTPGRTSRGSALRRKIATRPTAAPRAASRWRLPFPTRRAPDT